MPIKWRFPQIHFPRMPFPQNMQFGGPIPPNAIFPKKSYLIVGKVMWEYGIYLQPNQQ